MPKADRALCKELLILRNGWFNQKPVCIPFGMYWDWRKFEEWLQLSSYSYSPLAISLDSIVFLSRPATRVISPSYLYTELGFYSTISTNENGGLCCRSTGFSLFFTLIWLEKFAIATVSILWEHNGAVLLGWVLLPYWGWSKDVSYHGIGGVAEGERRPLRNKGREWADAILFAVFARILSEHSLLNCIRFLPHRWKIVYS